MPLQASQTISPAERSEFEKQGAILLRGEIPENVITELSEGTWSRLERFGIKHSDPSSWDSAKDPRLVKQMNRSLKTLGNIEGFFTPRLLELAAELLNTTQMVQSKPKMLLTFPQEIPEPYSLGLNVPSTMWHMDMPRLANGVRSGLTVLGFVENVQENSGGTPVVLGSHRLLQHAGRFVNSKHMKRYLRKFEYFQLLWSKNAHSRYELRDSTHVVDEEELTLVELTGSPGDLYVLDSRILHSVAPNYSQRVRLMVLATFRNQAVDQHYIERYQRKNG